MSSGKSGACLVYILAVVKTGFIPWDKTSCIAEAFTVGTSMKISSPATNAANESKSRLAVWGIPEKKLFVKMESGGADEI